MQKVANLSPWRMRSQEVQNWSAVSLRWYVVAMMITRSSINPNISTRLLISKDIRSLITRRKIKHYSHRVNKGKLGLKQPWVILLPTTNGCHHDAGWGNIGCVSNGKRDVISCMASWGCAGARLGARQLHSCCKAGSFAVQCVLWWSFQQIGPQICRQ